MLIILEKNDIALPILSQADAVLIHADVPMTTELISRIRNLGTRTVYIKDEQEGILTENTSSGNVEEEYPYKLEETAKNSSS